MGCINSKKESTDINSNPNLYRVMNVDDDGNALWSGQLGITRFELTLYRKGKDATTWPLNQLRRYGYDTDLFTFEAGRRCTTGEGIYAFHCRRAESLFQTLQCYMQLPVEDAQEPQSLPTNGPVVIPRNLSLTQTPTPSSGGYYIMNRPTSQSLSPIGTIHSHWNCTRSADTLSSEGNYLDPTPNRPLQISRFQSALRLGSISSGPLIPDPGSPSSITNILEVTQLNPLPVSNPGISNLYQEFPLKEYNNNSSNKKVSLDCPPESQAPSRSLSVLRKELATLNVNNDDDDVRGAFPSFSSTVPPESMENSRITYMNIDMSDSQVTKAAETPKIVQTPTTSVPMFSISRMNSSFMIDPNRCYENLEPGDIRPLTQRSRVSKPDIFAKVELPSADKSEPSTPTHPGGVVYITLDLEQVSSAVSTSANISTTSVGMMTNSRPTVVTSLTTSTASTNNSSTNSTMPASLLPPDSPKKGVLDYATIDFNKTVALSNSTTPSSELDSEGSRKTRHSSVATFGSYKYSSSISD